ncbi:MAG: hypothetical protein HPY85_00380 [Anaerolineae bacterium]|nr:hypothetical protein [Anaerolineae bacterium]
MTAASTTTKTDSAARYFPGILAGFLLVSGACALIYGRLLLDPNAVPWGSDTLGHVFRYEFLRQSITEGIWLPDFVPQWYLSIQLFRYYPPLLYYPLAWLSPLFDNPVTLSTWFIIACAWGGGLSWLLFHRRLGWPIASAAGILYLLLPDLVRVAFAEGNLLRHFANALLPVILYLLMVTLEQPKPRKILVPLGLTFTLLVLSHPMIASITAAVAVLFLLASTVLQRLPLSHVGTTTAAIAMGILSASFWLFPSMNGGITELSKQAMAQGLPVVSVSSLFNPMARLANIETLYVGLALAVVPMLLMCHPAVRKNHTFWALLLTGWVGCLLVTPVLNQLFNALPLSTLMWPARFLTAASVFLLAACVWGIRLIFHHNPRQPAWQTVAVCLLLLILVDFTGSRRLIFNRPDDGEQQALARQLSTNEGWRQATLDHSRTGSAPSYYASSEGMREQVFGWGFQGARTATLVSGINEALQVGRTAYAIDRLNLAGVDDVWVANQIPQPYGLESALAQAGFQSAGSSSQYRAFHRPGAPRVIVAEWDTIGIGTTAQNYAYLFPQIITADSAYIDDYSLETLSRYRCVILAGFTWHNKNTAETLVTALAKTGTRVVIDLTKTRENPLSQQPDFLDVWGERVILDQNPIQLASGSGLLQLSPFHDHGSLWYTLTPQNLDQEWLTSDFLGQSLVLTGTRQVGTEQIWFIGLNLPYHAVINQDEGSVRILEDVLQIPAGQPMDYHTIPLEHYTANGKMIAFDISLEESRTILLPFAHFDGTRVSVDGTAVETTPIANLIQLDAPAGQHHYQVTFQKPATALIGWATSTISLLCLIVFSHFSGKPDER